MHRAHPKKSSLGFVLRDGTAPLAPNKREREHSRTQREPLKSEALQAEIRTFQNHSAEKAGSHQRSKHHLLPFYSFTEVLKHEPSGKERLHTKPRAPGKLCGMGIVGKMRAGGLNGIKQMMRLNPNLPH